jgi:hypothetical protein
MMMNLAGGMAVIYGYLRSLLHPTGPRKTQGGITSRKRYIFWAVGDDPEGDQPFRKFTNPPLETSARVYNFEISGCLPERQAN